MINAEQRPPELKQEGLLHACERRFQMRQAVVHCLGIAILIGFVGTTRVAADPITITGGQTIARLANGSFFFTGKGLSAGAGLPDGFAISVVQDCSPCSADQPVTLS